MAVNPRLVRLLAERGTSYEVIPHREVFTANEVAMTSHIPGREFAKVLILRDDAGADFMVVLPAAVHMNPQVVRHVTGRHGIQLEDEAELNRLFPDCEVGAMPPFGALYGLPMKPDQWVECFPVVAMSIPRFAEQLWESRPAEGITVYGGILPGRP